MRQRFALFHYFHLDLTLSLTQGFRLLLHTPLFGFAASLLSREFNLHARAIGLDVMFLPASWRFRIEEGSKFYRYEYFLGWLIPTERWRAFLWTVEKTFRPPRCSICSEAITDFWSKPFVPRKHWQHARCANLERKRELSRALRDVNGVN